MRRVIVAIRIVPLRVNLEMYPHTTRIVLCRFEEIYSRVKAQQSSEVSLRNLSEMIVIEEAFCHERLVSQSLYS